MASNSLKIFARPAGRFIRPMGKKNLSRSFSAISFGKTQRKSSEFSRRNFSDSHSNIVKSSLPEIEFSGMPLHEFIFQNVAQWENKIAIICHETKKKLTYKDLIKMSKCLAASYQKKFKLEKNDRQMVILPNCPEYTALLLGGSMSGIVTSTVNPIYTSVEISHQMSIVQPKIVFTTIEGYEKCVEAIKMNKIQIPIVVIKFHPETETPPGAIPFAELIEGDSDFVPVRIDVNDDLVIPFSSGTGGFPKGVQLTHKNITSNLAQYAVENDLKSNRETDQSVILGILPMFHIYGMVIVTLDSLFSGARLVSLPKFDPKLFIDAIHTHKTEITYLVPPLVFFLANQPMVEPKYLESVQYVVTGAAPCGASDIQKLETKCPNLSVRQGYGMTETSPLVSTLTKERKKKKASVGHPIANTMVKIADLETGEPLPRNKRGEIRVKGPQVMKGYLDNPEATKNTFDSDGWLKTGDIGYFDDDEDLYVVDRLKELIKVKGFQVAPAELEETLRMHPKVADVAVVGVTHPELGEAPKAFIVLKKDSTAKEDEIQGFIKEKLTSYKQLKGGVEFVNEIPRSSAGKILRRNLKNINS